VVAVVPFLNNNVNSDVDYAEERSIWKVNRLNDDNGKIKKFNTIIDAINYFSKTR